MSNDVSIQVFNNTLDQDIYICVFQKPDEANANEIYTTLFPVAWKILALGPNQTCDPIIYPVQLQLSVAESQPAKNAINRATFQDCDEGQVGALSVQECFRMLPRRVAQPQRGRLFFKTIPQSGLMPAWQKMAPILSSSKMSSKVHRLSSS